MRIIGLGGACVRRVLQPNESQATSPCHDMLSLNTDGTSCADGLRRHVQDHHILLDPLYVLHVRCYVQDHHILLDLLYVLHVHV